jgi:hypothetical protein
MENHTWHSANDDETKSRLDGRLVIDGPVSHAPINASGLLLG